jgi:hypothetical protein
MVFARLLVTSVLCMCASSTSMAALLTLDPANGALNGLPGLTTGWGFSVSNDTGYLVITSVDYSAPVTVGMWEAYAILPSNFAIVGPNETWSQPFDSVAQTGLGAVHINDFEVPGTISSGVIAVEYDLFSVSPADPDFEPDLQTLSVGNVLSADASVTVTSAPEPATGLLLLAGAVLIILSRRGRYRGLVIRSPDK